MRHHSLRLDSQELTPAFLAAQDCVVVVTDHSAYDWDEIARHTGLLVDTRNAAARCVEPRCRIVKA